MSQNDTIDLQAIKTFFDPHPGFAGAAIPIPHQVKEAADKLDGQSLTLAEALECLRSAYPAGRFEVVAEYDFVSLWLDGGRHQPSHMFRVIRYR